MLEHIFLMLQIALPYIYYTLQTSMVDIQFYDTIFNKKAYELKLVFATLWESAKLRTGILL